jgi:hypothetical protein
VPLVLSPAELSLPVLVCGPVVASVSVARARARTRPPEPELSVVLPVGTSVLLTSTVVLELVVPEPVLLSLVVTSLAFSPQENATIRKC